VDRFRGVLRAFGKQRYGLTLVKDSHAGVEFNRAPRQLFQQLRMISLMELADASLEMTKPLSGRSPLVTKIATGAATDQVTSNLLHSKVNRD
jgi:hypothetical protein